MKIIVDKMPNKPEECIFSECTNRERGNYACNLYQGMGWEPSRCRFLKPFKECKTENKHNSDEIR